jgi:uncharacterized membrane protein
MKHKGLFTVIFLLVFSLALTGCANIREEIWIEADYTGKVTLEMSVSEALITAANALDSTLGTTLDPRSKADQDFGNNQFVQNYTFQDYSDGTNHYYTTTFDVVDFKAFLETLNNELLDISLGELENGNLGYSQKLAYSTGLEEFTSSSEILKKAFEAAKASAMKSTTWQVTLHLPNVITTNGTQSENVEGILWSYPMSAVASANPPLELTAEYRKPLVPTEISGAAWFPWTVGGVGLLIVGGILTGVLVSAARKRKAAAASATDFEFNQPDDFSQ